jgi:hypothetical protein
MVRFKNQLTGGDMWVDETRVEEYKAAGHVPAAEAHPEPEATKPARKSRKKSATKAAEKNKAENAGE